MSYVPCLIYFTSMFLVSISVILKIRRTVSHKCPINFELVPLKMSVSKMHILIYKLQCIKSIYWNKTFSERNSKLTNIHIHITHMQVQYLCFNMMTFVIFNFMLILSCFWIIYRYQHTYRCFTNQSNRKILRHPENWKNIQCRGFRTKKTVPVEKDVAVHEGSYRSLIKPIGFTVMVSICTYYLYRFYSYGKYMYLLFVCIYFLHILFHLGAQWSTLVSLTIKLCCYDKSQNDLNCKNYWLLLFIWNTQKEDSL